jgi:hypothetical protein
MTRTIRTIAALVPVLAASLALAATPYSIITKTKHNFSVGGSTAWSDTQICRPCHTPHNSVRPDITDRIWAHTLSPDSTLYTMRDGTHKSPADALDPVSRLCMGCHDGTVALGDYVGSTTPGAPIGAGTEMGPFLGTNLENDHPVGKTAVYDTSRLNDMSDPTKGKVGIADKTKDLASLSLVNVGDATTPQWVVGCKTCHNPHGTNLNKPTVQVPYAKLLNGSNQNSQLCLTCHSK